MHTDAIQTYLILPELSKEQISMQYADEADMLNMALFGKTARQWRTENKGKKGNIRDNATLQQLLVLSNMESYNAMLIEQGKSQPQRLQLLRNMAISQLRSISELALSSLPMIKEDK